MGTRCLVQQPAVKIIKAIFFSASAYTVSQPPPETLSSLPLISLLQQINDFVSSEVGIGVIFNHLQNDTKTLKIKRLNTTYLGEDVWDQMVPSFMPALSNFHCPTLSQATRSVSFISRLCSM